MKTFWNSIESNRRWLGMQLLRLGMAAVFLWFGFSQIFNSLAWVAIVPMWASNLVHLPPAMIVLGNGAFEILAGTLMAMSFLVRPIAFLLAIHLLPIALSFGLTATCVRDLGLSLASLALSLIYTRAKELPPPTSSSATYPNNL